MNLLALADDDGVRPDLTAQPTDLVVSLRDIADPVILEAARRSGAATRTRPFSR
jgi:hypothetical protein